MSKRVVVVLLIALFSVAEVAGFQSRPPRVVSKTDHNLLVHRGFSLHATSPLSSIRRGVASVLVAISAINEPNIFLPHMDYAFAASTEDSPNTTPESSSTAEKSAPIDTKTLKVPYNHENLLFGDFLGEKATIVFNMKIDDPQTVLQFPEMNEMYKKYGKQGLNVHAFPTEQGWFEPDDDETCRAKAKEYYGFGDYPHTVVFDKVDLLGPSANPLYAAITKALPTPNGYGRITLNYEKFLLDSSGNPVRRYPRKFTAYDMEQDIKAVLEGKDLPPESPAFQKAWREAKREVAKSEYSFRYNYNYYTAPDSMYKYNPEKDKVDANMMIQRK